MQRKIILFLIIVFILSSAYLLSIGSKFGTDSFSTGWWSVYFSDPKSNDLNFVIENHTDKTNFHWEILADKEKIKEGEQNIASGQSVVVLANLSSGLSTENKKITITVSVDDEKKEIYKNF